MALKTEKKNRVRRDKTESRDQILDRTLGLIGHRGWEASTFAAIAKATKMSPANIAYHFGSREILLKSLLEKISNSNIALVAQAMQPEFNAYQRLVTHITKNLEWAEKHPESAQVLVHIYVSASHDKTFAQLYAAMIERAHGRIKEHLLAGQREGLFQTKIETELLAKTIHDLIVGAFIKIIATRLTTRFRYPTSDWELILTPLLEIRAA